MQFKSIFKIKSRFKPTRVIDFNFVTSNDILEIIMSLKPTKNTVTVLFHKNHFERSFFLRFVGGFGMRYSTHFSLVNLLQREERFLDEFDSIVSTLLMKLSNTYVCKSQTR